MKISLREAADELWQASSVVITSHQNPDGDAIGSALGLMHFLQSLGKKVIVLIDDDIPAIFSVLPGYELIGKVTSETAIEADLLVALDVDLDRIGRAAEVVKTRRPILNIDHHVTNADNDAKKLYLDGTCAATAEIIYQLIIELRKKPDAAVAMALYTGIATDCGWFRYSNTTPNTLKIAADLLAAGAKPSDISEALEQKSYDRVKSLAAAMGQIELFHDKRAAGVFLDFAAMEKLEHTDGLIDMIRVIEGTDIAVVMKEKELGKSRVSMRSKGLDVTKIAVKFGGGGHIRAAGCAIEKNFSEAKQELIAAIDEALDAAQEERV